jgi:plastocyanin
MRLPVRALPIQAIWQRRGSGLLLAALLCASAGHAVAQAGSRVHPVSMEAVGFSPAVLKVMAGDTIEWRNADPFPHNVTARDGTFRSGDIAPGQSWQVKVGKKGRFPYACTLHPGMEAMLVVE